MMDYIRPDGTSFRAPSKNIENFLYGYSKDGKIEKIEKVKSSESNGERKIIYRETRYFNARGFLVAEARTMDNSTRGVEYINQKVDSRGNLISYSQCTVAGEWGKHSECATYNTKITYYK